MAGTAGDTPRWVSLEATSAEEALRRARQSGYRVLAVAGDTDSAAPAFRWRGGGRLELLVLIQQLTALLEAGLNLMEALQTLRRKERQSEAQRVLDDVLSALQRGLSLSDAMEARRDVFPLALVAAVRASERSGGVVDALNRFSAYQTQMQTLRRSVVSASRYPALLIVVSGLVALLLLGFVVPRYAEVLRSAQRELGGASQWLFALGLWVAERRLEVFGSLAALGLGMTAGVLEPRSRKATLGWVLARWPLRRYAEDHARAQFYRTLAVLLDTGTPLLQGMQMCAELLPRSLRDGAKLAVDRVRGGLTLSEAMAGTELLTPISESLVRAGERSGRLSSMLERSADFLEEDLARAIDALTRLLGPTLVLLIGLFIGWIVVVVYMQFATYPHQFRMR